MEHFYPQPSFVKLGWGLFLSAQFLFYVCSQMESLLAWLRRDSNPRHFVTRVCRQRSHSFLLKQLLRIRTDIFEQIPTSPSRVTFDVGLLMNTKDFFQSRSIKGRRKLTIFGWKKQHFFAEPLNELKLKCLAGTCSIKMLQLWMNIKYLFCSIHAY